MRLVWVRVKGLLSIGLAGTYSVYANYSVPVGRVLFEIGGHVEVRAEVAKDGMYVLHLRSALRLAAAKLPIRTEFITISTPPRLGRDCDTSLTPTKLTSSEA